MRRNLFQGSRIPAKASSVGSFRSADPGRGRKGGSRMVFLPPAFGLEARRPTNAPGRDYSPPKRPRVRCRLHPFRTLPAASQHFLRPSIPVVRPLHGIVYPLSPSIPIASRTYSGQYSKEIVHGNSPREKGNIPQFYSSLMYSAHTHRFASLSSRILDTGFMLPARLLLPLKALPSICLIFLLSSFTGILNG